MLLLARDPVTLYASASGDSHGWATGDPGPPLWTGTGNLQRAPGRSDPLAGDAGGGGPFAPASIATSVLFLPPDAPVADGLIADVAGQRFALSQTRIVADPRGTADLDCWTATATAGMVP
jgi:hypothetical protein